MDSLELGLPACIRGSDVGLVDRFGIHGNLPQYGVVYVDRYLREIESDS